MVNVNETVTLLVEDNDYYREEMKALLSKQFSSLTIVEASEGEEALAKFAQFKPDLIFMDIALPGKNGLKLTREIKKVQPETVVAILTSYDSVEYCEAAKASGADHFLVKDSATSADIAAIVELVTHDVKYQ